MRVNISSLDPAGFEELMLKEQLTIENIITNHAGGKHKMLNLNIARADKDKVADGVWCTFRGTTKYKLRRFDCAQAVEARVRLLAEFKEGYGEESEIDEKAAVDLGTRVLSEANVADWNVKQINEAGELEDVPCTPENVYEVLKDPKYAELFAWIVEQCRDFENYRVEIRAKQIKKSES